VAVPKENALEAAMSFDVTNRPRRIASIGVAETTMSGRRFAGILTGGAVALSLALGAAMPAKADKKDDLAKALLGALVVGVIVKELNDKPKAVPAPVVTPEPVRTNRVPAVCAISIDGAERSVTLYPESCLRREGFDRRLPRDCANQATIFGRDDSVYSAQCLRDAGFRVSGR
jgi:hypothetical protein